MKPMFQHYKQYILLLFFMVFGSLTFAQDAVVQTLNPLKCPNVKIKVPHDLIKHEAWEDGGIRVDIKITSMLPDVVVQALVKAGRYQLDGKKVGEDYIITAPNMDIPLLLDGEKISENIAIKITTPAYFAMADVDLYKEIDESVVRARSGSREEISALLKKMKEIRSDMNVHIKVQSLSTRQDVELSEVILEMNGKEVTADQLSFPKVAD